MASAGIRKTSTGRYKVWWRLDDASQGSQTFDTRDQARDFKHDLLARLVRGTWIDPRLGKQTFETWTRDWWGSWSADPDHSPRTLQAAETRLRLHLLPTLGQRQLRAITVSVVRRWQNDLRATIGYDTVMACRSLLYRILQAAEDDRRIEANPVRKVSAPKPPVDPVALLGRAKRRAYTPEEFGYLLAGTPPFYRDHFITAVGTGLRAGELLGLRARRVDLERRQLEVLEVRYDAGRFGSGYKNRPKSPASIRVIPLAGPVVAAITRRLPPDADPAGLVFTGPGGSNGLPRGARSAMSRHGLLRVYKHALVRVADPVASLAYTPRRVLAALRDGGPQTAEQLRGKLRGRTPRPATVEAALATLHAAGLATEDPPGRWIASDPPSRDDLLGQLRLRGPHDLRHTFATWLEDAGIPARVIDELMGHVGGQRGGGAPSHDGSLIGTRYRWTTSEMQARVVAAIEQRLAVSSAVAGRATTLGHIDSVRADNQENNAASTRPHPYQRSASGPVYAGSRLDLHQRCSADDRCEPLGSNVAWTKPGSCRLLGPVWSRTPSALRSSAARDRMAGRARSARRPALPSGKRRSGVAELPSTDSSDKRLPFGRCEHKHRPTLVL